MNTTQKAESKVEAAMVEASQQMDQAISTRDASAIGFWARRYLRLINAAKCLNAINYQYRIGAQNG